MILMWWAPTVRLVSIRGLSPACRRVVNNTRYKLLIRAYHLGLSFLREMCMVRYLFTYIHWTVVALYRSVTKHTLSLSLDISTEKSVALYIPVMGRLKVYTSFGKRDHLICQKIECRQVGIIKPCRAVARGVEAVCSNPPFGPQKILYTT